MNSKTKDQSDSYQSYRRLISLSMAYLKIFIVAIIGMILVAGTDTSLATYVKTLMDRSFVQSYAEVTEEMNAALTSLLLSALLICEGTARLYLKLIFDALLEIQRFKNT